MKKNSGKNVAVEKDREPDSPETPEKNGDNQNEDKTSETDACAPVDMFEAGISDSAHHQPGDEEHQNRKNDESGSKIVMVEKKNEADDRSGCGGNGKSDEIFVFGSFSSKIDCRMSEDVETGEPDRCAKEINETDEPAEPAEMRKVFQRF